jgi:hypothetical protein
MKIHSYWAYEEGEPVLKESRKPADYHLNARTRKSQMFFLEEFVSSGGDVLTGMS